MEESVRQYLEAAAADRFPRNARFGSAEAGEYLRRRRARQRPPRELTPVGEVHELHSDGGVPVRVYVPEGGRKSRPLVVYFHGGGWVMGDLDMHDPTCRSIAAGSSAVVVNVDYRLAPENPFPAPLDDCYEATQWAVKRATDWGADGASTVIGGTSAGGNLAAAVTVRRRDSGEPPLAGLVLLYPVLDCRMQTRSFAQKADGYLLTADEMSFFWDAYVQDGRDRTHPWLSPGLVEDLAGLPPTLVVTAEHDPLRDEGRAFAARLDKDSLLVRHLNAEGQVHGFLTAFPSSPAAKNGISAVIDAIGTMAAGSPR